MGIYKELTEGGLFSLHFILHIYDSNTNIYLINENENLNYNGITYQAAAFAYNPSVNGDATLEISIHDNAELLNIVGRSRRFNCDLVGVFKGGEIVPIGAYKHQYGDAS